ncbi:MAG TPA: hypothetical protein VEI97_20245 [bacterium]|nr:hypothetical protein [bacterium]
MLRSPWPVAILAAALAAGCGSPTPLLPADHPTAAVSAAGPLVSTLGGHATLGIYTLRIDPDTAATAVEVAWRQTAATDDIYEFSPGAFMPAPVLRVDAVDITPTTVDLRYRVRHPFAAPADPAAPASASNRADLGIAGRLLFLGDVPSADGFTFFGDIVTNHALVWNADGYLEPRGMLEFPGYTANTFPYKLLVDETLNPRTSTATSNPISNGGVMTGNYLPGIGWQRGNLGQNRDAWTGFGVLHQGQEASNMVALNRLALGAGPVELKVALIAKYTDPRGGATGFEKRLHRLPPETPDIGAYVYRQPHGALDIDRIRNVNSTGVFVANTVSSATVRFRVIDWDARAPETTLPDLAQEPDPMKVAIGESGTPSLAISIPGITGGPDSIIELVDDPDDDDSAWAGDTDQDTGYPGDGLFYEEQVTKEAGTGQGMGIFVGLVRATDPEASLTGRDWYRALGEDLVPVTGVEMPEAVVYQRFEIGQMPPP